MNVEGMVRLSRLTRPFMRYRTPVIYRLLKWTLNVLCPPRKKATAQHLVATFDGGLINIDTSSSIEYHILFRGCHEPEIVNLIRRVVRTICGATLQRELGLDRCDFLKIDVEGFESVVLKELSDLIAAHRPFIICEYRKQHWENSATP